VDEAETPMFYLEKEIGEKISGFTVQADLGDVTQMQKMDLIFRDFVLILCFMQRLTSMFRLWKRILMKLAC
jgi:hypothetical protein